MTPEERAHRFGMRAKCALLFALLSMTMVPHASAQTADQKEARYEAARTANATPVNIIIGDSITEGLYATPSYGGCKFYNAGISGIDAQSMLLRMDNLLRNSKVGFAIIMLGVNNAFTSPPADVNGYLSAMTSIVAKIEAKSGTVMLAQIMPIELGKALSDSRSQDAVNALNRAVYYNLSMPGGVCGRVVELRHENSLALKNAAGHRKVIINSTIQRVHRIL